MVGIFIVVVVKTPFDKSKAFLVFFKAILTSLLPIFSVNPCGITKKGKVKNDGSSA